MQFSFSVHALCFQLSGLYVDCQSLVQALEELPLHLKLNVAAEVVQDATPVTLPQIKLQSHDVAKKSGDLLQQQKRVGSCCYPKEDSAVPLTLSNKDESGISSEAFQRNPSSLHQVIDHLDEDLDLLLKLDVPINPENNNALKVEADGLPSGDDLTKTFEETGKYWPFFLLLFLFLFLLLLLLLLLLLPPPPPPPP
uniref:Uncharacterized protein n=1 Tax=Laticauda laticaudata TaxID=8630 RepID=A0A8C5SBM2_LATLA